MSVKAASRNISAPAASETGKRAATTADELAQVLRTRIQTGEIPPGEWLREIRLGDEFGVGRSIVRRALRALADDGLIEIEENRGARVSATTVEEVFDLYEVRAALYGLATRCACLRAPDAVIQSITATIDQLLSDAAARAPAEQIIGLSEAIFSEMSAYASIDARRMIEAVRRKTRFHFSYVALALTADGPGPYDHWRRVRAGLLARDANAASQAARDILYFMQGEVARIMLARGPRLRLEPPMKPAPSKPGVARRPRAGAGKRR
jgi:DNA-binding GntR family transcriptional regulator